MGDGDDSFGFLTIEEARRIAEEQGLDLVEVAPEANPPVCRLMDMGKHKYKQKKRLQEQRKHQLTVELKEIWLRPRIEGHDLEVKLNRAKGFLDQGFRVAMTMRFRARELLHKELGVAVLKDVAEKLKDVGKVDSENSKEARRMQIVIAPLKNKKGQ
jgi:translation initiation factor IF-3